MVSVLPKWFNVLLLLASTTEVTVTETEFVLTVLANVTLLLKDYPASLLLNLLHPLRFNPASTVDFSVVETVTVPTTLVNVSLPLVVPLATSPLPHLL